jgi:hypothetical protein
MMWSTEHLLEPTSFRGCVTASHVDSCPPFYAPLAGKSTRRAYSGSFIPSLSTKYSTICLLVIRG